MLQRAEFSVYLLSILTTVGNYKNIIYKILLLCVLMVCFNYIYQYAFYENDIQAHSPVINKVRAVVEDGAEVVYIGESSNITYRENDIDKRTISDFIADYFPTLKVGDITKEASHAGIYYELMRNIPETAAVKTVVVTLNLRSFDANWIYSPLETPLQKSLVLLKDRPPLVNRLMLAFRGYDVKTDAERERQVKHQWKHDKLTFETPFTYDNVIDWDNGMAAQGIKKADGSIDPALTELACHYVKTYAFIIDTLTNPRIKDVDRIVALAKERNWHLVFNLLAENVEMADSLVGKELVYLMKHNRDILMQRYNRDKVQVVDNLTAVRDKEFIDRNWTTEHYAENGRKLIARNVAQCLKTIYPAKYVNVTYSQEKPSVFVNNCEGKLTWGQMQTLSDEQASSGKRSSKTGQGQEFSVTYEYPVANLPDSLKQVFISMQVFQTGLNHDAALAIELSGEHINYLRNTALIKELTGKTKGWTNITYAYTLPAQFYKADLMKVYVHNPSGTVIYVDDISLTFKK